MKFQKGSAKSVKNIKQKKDKGGGFGNMLWIKKDSSKTVRIIAEPKGWIEYNYVGLENNADGDKMNYRKLPCYEGYGDDFPGADALRVRTMFAVPVVEIDEDGKPGDRVMFYEPGAKVLDSLLNRFERRKTLTDCDVEIIREGSGKNGTTYDLYWEDPKKRAKLIEQMSEKVPDIDEDFVRMVQEASQEFNKDAPEGGSEEDEDDEPKKGKKAKKSKAAKKRAMRDEEEDDEEEADDEDEESEEEDAEDDDAEEGDDDEEADDEEDEESEEDDEEGDDEDEEGELPTEDEIDDMAFKDLKAFANENDVEVPSGAKSAGYKKAIKAWLEEQSEGDDEEGDEDDEGDEEGEERVESTFVLSNIDDTAFTLDLEDADGNEYETVYLDRERDADLVGKMKDGAKYKFVIELDEQEDWVAVTQPEPLAKPKKAAAKKGGKKAPAKKGKGKSKK